MLLRSQNNTLYEWLLSVGAKRDFRNFFEVFVQSLFFVAQFISTYQTLLDSVLTLLSTFCKKRQKLSLSSWTRAMIVSVKSRAWLVQTSWRSLWSRLCLLYFLKSANPGSLQKREEQRRRGHTGQIEGPFTTFVDSKEWMQEIVKFVIQQSANLNQREDTLRAATRVPTEKYFFHY